MHGWMLVEKRRVPRGNVRLAGLLLALIAGCTTLPAPPVAVQPLASREAERTSVPDAIRERSFPFLQVLNAQPGVRDALLSDQRIVALAAARRTRIDRAISACSDDANCLVTPWLWSDEEVANVGDALTGLTARGELAEALRATGSFPLYTDLADDALILRTWQDTASGLNGVLRTYGLSEAPFYPKIDSARFEAGDVTYAKLLRDASDLSIRPNSPANHPFEKTVQFALLLLHLNERENAGFYPALDADENGPARAFASEVDWSRFSYTAILVLGDGPDEVGTELGSFGKLRLFHAAELYWQGQAPFLIVSGGNVHPAATPINEAETMRRVLMQRYGIPERAIIMEPHARHTTTNFRNAARLMIRYGFPLDRPALVSTSRGQSAYAEGEVFRERCLSELGYSPMRMGERLSPFDQEFWVEPVSLQLNPADPLDP